MTPPEPPRALEGKSLLALLVAASVAAASGVSAQSVGGGPASDPPPAIDLGIQVGTLILVGGKREMAYVSDSRVLMLDGVGPLMAFGLSMRLGRSGSAWNFGPSFFRVPSSEVEAIYGCRRDLEVPCASVLIQRQVDVAATSVTVDAAFAPGRDRLGLSSSVVAGLGVRWDSVRWSEELTIASGSETRTGAAGKVGAAIRWRWAAAAIGLRAEDYMGWLRDPGPGITHDLVLSLALEWRP